MRAWQATVQNETGNIVSLPTVNVYEDDGVTLADVFDNTGVADTNPVTGSIDGFVQVYLKSGKYKIEAEIPGSSTAIWDVSIDEATVNTQAELADVTALDVALGEFIRVIETGFVYQRVASGGDFIADGIELDALPMDDGSYSVVQFGAVGNNSADNAAALARASAKMLTLVNNAIGGLAVARMPRLIFPPSLGFRTSATFEIDGWVDVIMHSPLFITGTANVALIGVRLRDNKLVAQEGPRHNNSILDVRRVTQSDWTQANDIGVMVDSNYVSNITIQRVDNFRVGFDICAGYGTLHLGEIGGSQVCYISSRTTPSQFTNQLHVYGGAFVPRSVNPGNSRYGIWVRGLAPSGANSIALHGQSYELSLATAQTGNPSAEVVPIVLDGTGATVGSIYAYNQRSEFNGPVLVRTLGVVRDVQVEWFEAGREFVYPSSLMLDNQSTLNGLINVWRKSGGNDPSFRPLFSTGFLADKAVSITGSLAIVAGLDAATNVGAAPATQTFSVSGAVPAFDADRYMTTGSVLRGTRVRLNGERTLAVRGTKKNGSSATMRVLCFDSAGVQITATGAVTTDTQTPAINTGVYGGSCDITINSANAALEFCSVLQFTANVATVFISVNSPTQGYEVLSLHGSAQRIAACDKMASDFAAPNVPTTQITNASAYTTGMVVWNSNAAAAGTPGWYYTSGATWKAMAAIAA